MSPCLFFVTLLGLKLTVHGQIPPSQDSPTQPSPPTEPSIPPPSLDLFGDLPGPNPLPLPDDGGIDLPPPNTQPAVSEIKSTDGPITSLAGNIQVVINDQLREIMRNYEITPEEMQEMLNLYARGGSPAITKSRTNPETGLQEIITLDFEQFATKSASGDDGETSQVTSVSPGADTIQGQPVISVKSGDGSSDTSPPRRNTLADLQDAAEYLRNQIRELDSQLLALDNAYRAGQITRLTRNQNAVGNRERRRQLESDLRTLQREISRMTMPQARRQLIRTANPGLQLPTHSVETDIVRLEMENRRLEEQLRRGEDPQLTSTSEIPRVQRRSGQQGNVAGQAGSVLPSYEALRQELLRIRARERYILRRLQMLSGRNARPLGRGRLPASRNVFLRRPVTRRINFSNTPRFSPRRTLTGSVARGVVQNTRMRLL